MTTPEDVLRLAQTNDAVGELCARLQPLRLPQAHLVAGCLFQAVWNHRSGHAASFGVSDYDVFYYDATDVSWEAENDVIVRVRAAAAGLALALDVKNQARVHLWYESRFGVPCGPLSSAREGIDRFPVECTCVGIDLSSGELYAGGDLRDLFTGTLRINPRTPIPKLFESKAASYQARWPWLRIAT